MDKPLAFQNLDLLRLIQAEPGLTPTALSERLARDPSNLTKTLKRLEAFIDRAAMALTEAGRAILAADEVADGRSGRPAAAGAPHDVFDVRHSEIRPNPDNDRRDWDSAEALAELDSLADTIVEKGLLQNLSVRPTPDGQGDAPWTLVGGERRWRAIGRAIEAGKLPDDFPITVRRRDYADEGEQREVALIENAQRRDLNPIEEAMAFKALKDRARTTAQIAALAKCTERQVQMRLQLLDLSGADQRRMTLPEDDPKFLSVSEARKTIQQANAQAKTVTAFEAAWTPRRRLILAEIRMAAGSAYFYQRVQTDPAGMEADEDAAALARQSMLRATVSERTGQAEVWLDQGSIGLVEALFVPDADGYARRLREELGLPDPGEAWSIDWLNPPFTIPPELQAKVDAAAAEDEERRRTDAANARARDAARDRLRETCAQAAETAAAERARHVEDAAPPSGETVRTIADQIGRPLPWTPDADGYLIDANGKRIFATTQNYYAGAGDAERAMAQLLAVTLNAAAGLSTPPPPADEETDDLDREAFIAAIADHMAALTDAAREDLGEVTAEAILDDALARENIAFGDDAYSWTHDAARMALAAFGAEDAADGDTSGSSEPGSDVADGADDALSPALQRLAGVREPQAAETEE